MADVQCESSAFHGIIVVCLSFTLQISFICLTKALYLKESQHLAAITNDMVKVDLKNTVSLPRKEERLFDSLLFSKSDKHERKGDSRLISSSPSTTNLENMSAQPIDKPSQRSNKQRKRSLAQTVIEGRIGLGRPTSWQSTKSIQGKKVVSEHCEEITETSIIELSPSRNSTKSHAALQEDKAPTIGDKGKGLNDDSPISQLSVPSGIYSTSSHTDPVTPPIAYPQPLQLGEPQVSK